MTNEFRAGRYITQTRGYRAFIPAPLPPDPPLRMDDAELIKALSDADRALGRLDGVSTVLPNPDLFVAMYVRQEAVLSSQIEGTQSTLEDLLEYEAEGKKESRLDVEEVVNYVAAMNYGLDRLAMLPLSLRLLREIHERLLRDVRGNERRPGDFRTSQNWVGPAGSSLNEAQYVPPPPHEMGEALRDFERFLHNRDRLPHLIHCGLAHAQFETIHPFLDGNGRVGRLLITFLLCERKILRRPLLYLSYYLKAHRTEYYERLMAVRHDGDWEGWLKFFLRGVHQVSRTAGDVAGKIMHLRENHRQLIAGRGSGTIQEQTLLDFLFEQPITQIKMVRERLNCAYGTAKKAVEDLCALNILREITGRQRNRRYRYDAYLDLFQHQALQLPQNDDDGPARTETEERNK